MSEDAYTKLAERLDMNVTGVPKKDGDFSPTFIEQLKLMYSPEEAELCSYLSVGSHFIAAEQVAGETGRPAEEVEQILADLAERGMILSVGGQYMLPPTPFVINYHQVREETTDDSIKAGELYQDYYIKDGFYRFYESSAAGTPHRRAVPVEQSIASGQQVLSHEDMGHYLDNANMGALALIPCPCRMRTERLGIRECKDRVPALASCLMVGAPAMMLAHRGEGKLSTREEVEQYLKESREQGLVMMTDNAEEMKNGVICACCGCCCSITRGLTRWDNPNAFARSDFVARVSDDCIACGECVDRCMFEAISVEDDDDKAQIDDEKCMGCGVCTVTCPTEALRLERLERDHIYETARELYKKVAVENEEAGQKRPVAW
jgi:ferredoxin